VLLLQKLGSYTAACKPPLGGRQQVTVAQLLVLCCAILPRYGGVVLD
jgi:hypothetical protein